MECGVVKKGRPFGGVCWLFKKNISVISHEFFNDAVSMIEVNICTNSSSNRLRIFGVWIPFDDGSNEKLAVFNQVLSVIEMYSELDDVPYIIMGDFNADLNRNKRYDVFLRDFIKNNNLECLELYLSNGEKKTYHKGNYSSTIDHIFVSKCLKNSITSYQVVDDPINGSDHFPVSCYLDNFRICEAQKANKINFPNKFHYFNWSDPQFKEKYLSNVNSLSQNMLSSFLKLNPYELIDFLGADQDY